LVKRSFLLILIFLVFSVSATAKTTFGPDFVAIEDNAGAVLSIQDIEINGKIFKKLVLPDDYARYTSYPETELFEKAYYFAAPEGKEPVMNVSVSGTQRFRPEELVPARSFIYGKDGFAKAVYEIPENRTDVLKQHAEIIFHGYSDAMKLYKVIVRPLVYDGTSAVLAGRIVVSVKFDSSFDDPAKSERKRGVLSDIVINYGLAAEDPVMPQKLIVPTFLDRKTEWVRLKIKDEGIYRVSGAALRNAGIDIGSVMCERIRLFSGAGKDIDNNPVVPIFHGAVEASRRVTDTNGNGIFDDNDHIIFYATGTTSRSGAGYYYNKYSEHSYYWIDPGIGSSETGRDISTLSAEGDAFTDVSIFKRYEFSDTRNGLFYKADVFTWFNSIIEPYKTKSISFNMKNISEFYPVTVKVNHSTEIPEIRDSEIRNTSNIRYAINSLTSAESAATTFTSDHLSSIFSPNSSNVMTMTNLNGTYKKYFNGYEITYYGTVSAGSSDEIFYNPPGTIGVSCNFITEDSSGRELFDITDPLNIRSSVIDNGTIKVAPQTLNSCYLLFSGTYKNPVEIRTYDNTSKQTLHSMTNQTDMVIISPIDFYDFLSNDETGYLRAHIEADNDVSTIKVVSIEDIFNEFGRGYQEPAATRNFIEYAKENWGAEYFLLAGDGNYYIKNESGVPEKNLIYPSDTRYSTSVGLGSDDFYANLYSTSSAQNVSLGRFTASNITELRNIIQKTIEHIKNSNPGIHRSKILLVADDERNPDFSGTWLEKWHISNTEEDITSSIPEYYKTEKVYLTEYPFEYFSSTGMYFKPKAQEDIVRKLQEGVNLFCFVGHGAPMQLAHERAFNATAFGNVSNAGKYYFMIGATCSFGVFNDPSLKTLSEQMLIAPNRGSVGLINSVRGSFSGPNELLVGAILNAAFEDPTKKLSIGKAFKIGKTKIWGTNSATYMLIGDPALVFFNDKTIVEAQDSVELTTLKLDSISSDINYALAPGITDRSGVLNAVIVDSKVQRSYFNWDEWVDSLGVPVTSPLEYELPGKVILSAKSSIENGSSVTKFILPKDLSYGENKGKVLFYGYNGAGNEFTGSINNVSIRGDADITVTDSIPPQIRILYNGLNYVAGDPIGSSPVIYAEISDENGINTSGGVGHKITIETDGNVIDATSNFNYELDSYRKGYTFYQFVDLAPGEHNIKVTAWDNFNNYNEKSETFTVISESSKDENWIGNLLNHPNPIKRKGTTFGFTVNSPISLDSYTLSIYTVNGRKIKVVKGESVNTANQFQQVFWDGRDADGDIPANGVYIYVLRAKFYDGKTVSKKGKLIFAR
jgi:hypothetical protein